MRRDGLIWSAICLLLVVITLAAYWGVWNFEFVYWDDNEYVFDNPFVKLGLTWDNVGYAFTTFFQSNWHPLTWLSHMADCHFFGLQSGAHHAVNLTFHLANTLLLFLLLLRMTGAAWPSGLAAALFAVHPLNVESVAWVAERKNVLSTFVGLLTLLAYVSYARRPSWRRYLVVFAGLAVGLLAKPMLVTLPFVCLLLDYWPLGRLRAAGPRWEPPPQPPQPQRRPPPQPMARKARRAERRKAAAAAKAAPPLRRSVRWLVIEKIPLFLLAAASSVVTYYAQQVGGAMADVRRFSIDSRLENAAVAYMAYIGKMFWPGEMAPLYMLPPQQDIVQSLLAAGGLAAITAAVVWAARRGRRYLAVGWFWYLGTLVPVIGLVQVGDQSMADRYAYVPLIGLFIMAAWGAAEWIGRWPAARPALASVAAVVSLAVLSGCVLVTRHQLAFWRSNDEFLPHALEVCDTNVKMHNNLAVLLWRRADDAENNKDKNHDVEKVAQWRKEALQHLDRVVELRPNDPFVHANYGHLLFEAGRISEAAKHVLLAIQQSPVMPEAHNTLGRIYWTQGGGEKAKGNHERAKQFFEGAVKEFREALKYNPGLMTAKQNLAKLLVVLNKTDEAQKEVDEMLALGGSPPQVAETWVCQARIDAAEKRADDAIAAYDKALRADPKSIAAHDELALIYWQQGKRAEAAPHLRAVLRLSPNPAAAAEHYGEIFRQQGNRDEACRMWTFMAWALATSSVDSVRNGAKALDLGRRAVALSSSPSAAALDALAAAYAATGRFPDALRAAQQALALANAAGDAALAQAIRARIALYQQDRPFREAWEKP
jgi:tetratricopeptide (TPR) repeat protein